MDVTELTKMIQIGEGYTMEFKTSISHIAKEICAFANAAGGRILIGVDDTGKKVGLKGLNRKMSEVQTIAHHIDPPLILDIETMTISWLLPSHRVQTNPIPQRDSFTFGRPPTASE